MGRRLRLTGLVHQRRGGAGGGDIAPPQKRGVLGEFEHLLKATGCPTCAHIGELERSFFSWFEIETFSAAEMRARIRASMGMCAAHSRTLVDEIGEGHVMTIAMREAVAGARAALAGGIVSADCPACDTARQSSDRATHVVLDGLEDSVKADLYCEHSGMCLPHVLHAGAEAEPRALRRLADRLNESLSAGHEDAVVLLIAGVDPGAERRRAWRQRLAPMQTTAASTLDGLCERFAVDACPVCLSVGELERRYVEWFVERSHEGDRSLRTDPGELCSRHFHDVFLEDRDVGAEVAKRQRGARPAELARLIDSLGGGTGAAPGRGGRDDVSKAWSGLSSARHCGACHARDQIQSSQLALVAAVLGLASARDSYLHSHGLCARHAMKVDDTEVGALVRQHADARLAVLSWELDETSRTYGWACRHEPKGPEQHAWLRAMAQIDGCIFEGAPAPPRVRPSRRRPASHDVDAKSPSGG